MASLEIQHNLDQLQRALEEYAALTGKTSEEVLAKKGLDLSIKLGQGYRARQWGGATRQSGLARRELESRRAAGEGTKVRPALMDTFRRGRAELTGDIRSAGQYRRRARELGTAGLGVYLAAGRAGLAARKRRAGLWNRIVAEEIRLRQKGIGVEAAGWFPYRKRTTSSGTVFVRNKRGRELGFAEEGKGFLRLGNLVPGSDIVGERYDLLSTAVGAVVADIAQYTHRKHMEQWERSFARLGKS